ncbi:MAG TPA: hypothetical protein DDW36_01245 [Candidatus Magasanikbacteria bacterium]|nr:hypothetical protein [Candidatus Magasanikbacteria bacterium]
MRIFMLSLDQKILDPSSSSYNRMKEYSHYVDELTIVVPSQQKETIRIAENIEAHATRGRNKIQQFFSLLNLSKKIVKEKKIDCITAQDPFFTGLIGWWVARRCDVALNVQIHGVFFNNPFWLAESWQNRLRGVLARFVVRRADSVRVVSNFLKEELLKNGVPKDRIVVVPAFVDIQALSERSPRTDIRSRYPGFKHIFLTISRMEPVKNLPMLVEAFASVVKKHTDALLLMVGEGSQTVELRRRVQELGLERNIMLEPWTDDTISYYKAADCLLFPSRHESFGMVPLEALACGCPLITFQTGWIDKRACVLRGIHCLDTHTPDAWAAAIEEFISDVERERLKSEASQPPSRGANMVIPIAYPHTHHDLYRQTARIVYPYTQKANLARQHEVWYNAIRHKRSYRLLLITQKINDVDDDLAFFIKWVDEFARLGAQVQVICLEKRQFDNHFPVYSLGKERGVGLAGRLFRFYKYIFTLKYDRVFVHMNPEYMTLGGWFWWLTGKDSYLWYTHYTMHIHLWLAHLFCKRLFAATPQSMPMYEHDEKRVIIGHGVPIAYWEEHTQDVPENKKEPVTNMLVVHRLCRSKRLEISIKALKLLPKEYRLTVYGRDVEKDYVAELHELVAAEGLEDRVTFKGPLPMPELRFVYPHYQLFPNMAWETIDKTMLEAMLNGLYPVTTPRNAEAIGLPYAPTEETPEAVADFILNFEQYRLSKEELQRIVEECHSLSGLITTMNSYVKAGT